MRVSRDSRVDGLAAGGVAVVSEPEQDGMVTRGEMAAFRMWIEEKFRSMTWKLGLAAFAGGALSQTLAHLSGPAAVGVAAVVGGVGYGVKAALVALLHR